MLRKILIPLLLCGFALAQEDNKVVTVEVIPEKITLHPGEQFQFKARGKNKSDRIVSSFFPEWSATGGEIDAKGVFIAGTNAGMYAVMATDPHTGAQGSAAVLVEFSGSDNSMSGNLRITSLKLNPGQKELSPGQSCQFTVTAFNAQGEAVSVPTSLIWRVSGGSIKGGVYQAGGTPGTFQIEVRAPNGVSATAVVIIKGALGKIVNIKVNPSAVRLEPYATQRFVAVGYDGAGNVVSFQPRWEATGGIIDYDGVYQAGSNAGDYFVRAVDPYGVAGTTSIEIKKLNIAGIEIQPQGGVLAPGEIMKFQVRAYDPAGKEIQAPPSWSATGGVIQSDGTYRAGTIPGHYLLKVTVDKIYQEVPIVIREAGPTTIAITPDKVRLQTGQTIQFKVVVADAGGNPIRAPLTWEAYGGTMVEPYLFKAGELAGAYFVRVATTGGLSAQAQVVIVEAVKTKADYVTIKPSLIKLRPGEQVQFKARALAQGVEVPSMIVWQVEGGQITEDGVYTAGPIEGKYLVTASADGVQARGPSTVIIEGQERAPTKAGLRVTPAELELQCEEKQQIAVALFNEEGKSIPGEFEYTATGGTLDGQGNYIAGNIPGTYSITVRELKTNLSQKVTVRIQEKAWKTEPIKIDHWKVGGGTEEMGNIYIAGQICEQNGDLLQLVLFKKDGSRKVLSQRSVSLGDTFECKGTYGREETKTIALVLYDKKLNAIYTFQKPVPKWPE